MEWLAMKCIFVQTCLEREMDIVEKKLLKRIINIYQYIIKFSSVKQNLEDNLEDKSLKDKILKTQKFFQENKISKIMQNPRK